MKLIVCPSIVFFITTCLHAQKITDSKIIQTVIAKDTGTDANKKGWWLTEPLSLIQTNLRETDSDLDPKTLVDEVKKFPFNTLLFSFGGITAHYPTSVSYHHKSDYLPVDKDLVGEVLKEAHKSGI